MRLRLNWLFAAVLTWLLSISSLPAIELATLVPDDAGICVETKSLYKASSKFLNGDLYRRLEGIPGLKEILDASIRRPQLVGDQLARELKLSVEEVGEGLLGKRLLLAVWPEGIDIKNVQGSKMLLLVEARDAAFAKETFDTLANDFRRAAPKQSQNLVHADRPYFVTRVRREEIEFEVCLATIDDITVLSGSESILRRVLELSKAAPDVAGVLGNMPAYQSGMARLKNDATIKIFVNPRPWDTQIAESLDSDENKGKLSDDVVLMLRTAMQAWKAADYWTMSADIEPHFSLESFTHFAPERLSPLLLDVGRMFSGEATFFEHIPKDAALAFAGRMNLGAVSNMLLESAKETDEENFDEVREMTRGLFLGMDLFEDILPRLGPDVGFYMAPLAPEPAGANSDPAGKPRLRPVEWVGAARIPKAAPGGNQPDVQSAIDSGLKTAMQLTKSIQDAKEEEPTANVDTIQKDGVKLTFMEGVETMPAGLVATYGFANGFLFGGTTPNAVGRCIGLPRSESLADNPRFTELINHRLEKPGFLVYLNGASLREILNTNPQFIIEFITTMRKRPRSEVEESLKIISQLAELGETIVLAGKIEDSGIAFSIDISVEPSPLPADGSR